MIPTMKAIPTNFRKPNFRKLIEILFDKETLAGNNSNPIKFPLDIFIPLPPTNPKQTNPKQTKPENKPKTNWQKEGF